MACGERGEAPFRHARTHGHAWDSAIMAERARWRPQGGPVAAKVSIAPPGMCVHGLSMPDGRPSLETMSWA